MVTYPHYVLRSKTGENFPLYWCRGSISGLDVTHWENRATVYMYRPDYVRGKGHIFRPVLRLMADCEPTKMRAD